MKAYIKPNISSYSITTHKFIASSQVIETPDIETVVGGFYECSNSGCRPNNYTWANNNDRRNVRLDANKNETYKGGTKYQYIGCYEFKSNGGNIKCETFHGTYICEGSQWDLFINANGDYFVRRCPDGVH